MSDFVSNTSAQVARGSDMPKSLSHRVGNSAFFQSGMKIEAGHFLGGAVVVDIIKVLSAQVIALPADGTGSSELVTEVSHQLDGEISAGLRDRQSDLQFFNPRFQVRPSLSLVDGRSRVHSAAAGEGRPVFAEAA